MNSSLTLDMNIPDRTHHCYDWPFFPFCLPSFFLSPSPTWSREKKHDEIENLCKLFHSWSSKGYCSSKCKVLKNMKKNNHTLKQIALIKHSDKINKYMLLWDGQKKQCPFGKLECSICSQPVHTSIQDLRCFKHSKVSHAFPAEIKPAHGTPSQPQSFR